MQLTYNNPTGLLSVNNQLDSFRSAIQSNRKVTGLATGFAAVDEVTDGLQKLTLLGGVAGAGKSTMAMQLALGVAQTEKIPVLFISYEMSEEDLISMAIQNLSNKTLKKKDLRKPTSELTPAEQKNYAAAVKRFEDITKNFYVLDDTKISRSIESIRNTIVSIQEMSGTENIFVVIDSFDDLLNISKFAERSQAQEEAIGLLESLQHNTGATILVVAQKDRNSLKGSSQDGLRGDISLYHKPTIVMELISYREILQALENEGHAGMKNERQRIENMVSLGYASFPALLYISKHRDGISRRVPMQFHGAYRSFEAGRVEEFNNPNKYKIYYYIDL